MLSVAAMSCLITSVHNGLGRHIQVLTAEQSKTALKFLWIGFCITPSAEATAKISISLMLIRITTSARWKCFFYTLIVSSIMITIISLISICSCRPVELLWDPSLKGRCDVEERTVVIFIQGGECLAKLVVTAIVTFDSNLTLKNVQSWRLFMIRYSPSHPYSCCGRCRLTFIRKCCSVACYHLGFCKSFLFISVRSLKLTTKQYKRSRHHKDNVYACTSNHRGSYL